MNNFYKLPLELQDLIFSYTDFNTCFINEKWIVLRHIYDKKINTLEWAIDINNLEILKYLISKFREIPTRFTFIKAIETKRYEILEYLCSEYHELISIQYLFFENYVIKDFKMFKIIYPYLKDSVKLRDKDMRTHLIDTVCRYGNLEIVKYLYENGYEYEFDSMAIDIVCINNHLEILKFLHSKNIEIKNTAMDYASIYGRLDIVKYLHSIGIDCSRNAIDYASKKGHLDVVKYLYDLNKPFNKALDLACLSNRIDVVKFLLEKNVKYCHQTIIHCGNLYLDDIVTLLLQHKHLVKYENFKY